ncbi:uncharacterized protein [Lepeophtheirus salmonis]|uniref:uncharacterized protein n=1 Tax=Lepeophtheirus salmonis TaxID=72036 RepID=UPI001AE6E0BE|nr:uncharacterized protein LOC121118621 [Lepeophtheirus salmonis]
MITLGTLVNDIDTVAKRARLNRSKEIIVEGVAIPCHEEALKTVPFFRGCLSFNNHGGDKIDLSGSGITFRGLAYNLRFVYVHEYLSPSYAVRLLSEALDHGNIQEILHAADYLQIRRSAHLAISFMRKHLDLSNVFSVLRLANDLHLKGLKESCLSYVGYHIHQFHSEDLKDVDNESLSQVLSYPKMLIQSEDDVYEFIQKIPCSQRNFAHLRINLCSSAIRKNLNEVECDESMIPRKWPKLLVASFSDCPEARYIQKSHDLAYVSTSEEDEDDEEGYLSRRRKRLKVMDEFRAKCLEKEEDFIQVYDSERETWSKDAIVLFKGGDKHGFMLLGERNTTIGFRRSDQCEDCSVPTPNKPNLQTIWKLDLEENIWKEICPFREELIGPMKAVYLNNIVYVIGLDRDLDIVRRKYDLSTSEVEGRPFGDDKISPELFYNSIFTHDNNKTLYLMECGDQNRRNTSRRIILSLNISDDSDCWTVMENGFRGTIYSDSSVTFASPDLAYISGGRNPSATKSFRSWCPSDGVWTDLNPMNSVRFAHGTCNLGDGNIVVIGGRGFFERDIVSSYEIYHPDKDQWILGTKETFGKNYYPNNVFMVNKPLRIIFRDADHEEGKDFLSYVHT